MPKGSGASDAAIEGDWVDPNGSPITYSGLGVDSSIAWTNGGTNENYAEMILGGLTASYGWRIGGWNEDLPCGGEDVFQDYKINRLHKFIKFNYNSFKLSTQPQRVDENLKKRDEHILSQIMDGDMNKLHQHISSYIFRLGSKAKCI